MLGLLSCQKLCLIFADFPSGGSGSSLRLNQSSSISSYVTLRRAATGAGVKVGWDLNDSQNAKCQMLQIQFVLLQNSVQSQ